MIKFSLLRQHPDNTQPKRYKFNSWLKFGLVSEYANVFLTINLVNQETSRELNFSYRGIDKSTNVISLEYPETLKKYNMLTGEIILCDEVIVNEAKSQGKLFLDHYAHIFIHGLLHLQGFDHLEEVGAQKMEDLEIKILQKLGIQNPYLKMQINEK